MEPVFTVGSIPETSYNVVKDQKYCGEIKVALTFNPEVNLSALLVLFNQAHAQALVLQSLYWHFKKILYV